MATTMYTHATNASRHGLLVVSLVLRIGEGERAERRHPETLQSA